MVSAGILGLAFLPAASAGAAVVSGAAEITAPNSATPLNSGGSATEYGVALPAAAKCPGDTAHEGYRVFSYLVPHGVSLSSLTVKGEAPFRGVKAHPYFGYIAYGTYYGPVNTDLDTGGIPQLPSEFTWARLTPRDLFATGQRSAVWDGGILCATGEGVVTNSWNTAILFTASSTDPGGFTWKVVHPPSTSIFSGITIGVALLVLAAILGVVAVIRGRRSETSGHGHQVSVEDRSDRELSGLPG